MSQRCLVLKEILYVISIYLIVFSLDYPNECEDFFKKVNVEYAVNGTGEVYNYVKKTN
jgi:hypothetical protein